MQLYSHPNLFIPSLSCGMSLPACHEGRQGISALRWGCHKQEQILAAFSAIGDILICRWWLEWGSSDLWTGLILIWLKLFNRIFILAGPTKPILLPLHNQSGFRGPVLQLSWSNQSIELCAISLPIVELNCRLQSFRLGEYFECLKGVEYFFLHWSRSTWLSETIFLWCPLLLWLVLVSRISKADILEMKWIECVVNCCQRKYQMIPYSADRTSWSFIKKFCGYQTVGTSAIKHFCSNDLRSLLFHKDKLY